MKTRHWALLAALLLAIPAVHVGAFVVGLAIGWSKAKRVPPRIKIRYVDRVAPRAQPSTTVMPSSRTADASR